MLYYTVYHKDLKMPKGKQFCIIRALAQEATKRFIFFLSLGISMIDTPIVGVYAKRIFSPILFFLPFKSLTLITSWGIYSTFSGMLFLISISILGIPYCFPKMNRRRKFRARKYPPGTLGCQKCFVCSPESIRLSILLRNFFTALIRERERERKRRSDF